MQVLPMIKNSKSESKNLKTNNIGFYVMAVVLAATATMFMYSGTAYAFPHASTVINSDNSDPDQKNANPVSVVVGHSDEPAYGVVPGVHTGEHDVEVLLSDAATKLPLKGANLTVDKYYFESISSFNAASSITDADDIQKNAKLSELFGDPGHYVSKQIVSPGVYGYRLHGIINYYGVAEIPIDKTVFCASTDGPTTKFNKGTWTGAFGCPENIESITFPKLNFTTP
ncbi:MAG TPA: hypothetical protein VM888_00170 [Chitinophagaceae bacterium]|jgi:hypothetical protein|nr:hypothetical protein [Chitinophagaceae bacterium]